MPLSPPIPRQTFHQRSIDCRGYEREDGLWDIEAHLVDIKDDVVHTQSRGDLAPGEPVHDMWVRLTVDTTFLVHAIEVVTDAAPFTICPNIVGRFQGLKGVRIGAGWTRTIKELLGDIKGCTHLAELLGPAATTAFQTIYPAMRARRTQAEIATDAEKRPVILNTCHAFSSESVIIKQYWPKFYTGAEA